MNAFSRAAARGCPTLFRFALTITISLVCAGWSACAWADPIAIAAVKHDGPVDFKKEILPLLTKNCVACHNAKKAENSLVLETPQSILKGGDSGPAVVPSKSAESLLLKVASHQDEPLMPPADNGVGAVAFSSEQLGLLKLWIDQGAAGEVGDKASPVKWQPLPRGVNPIYAVALSPDEEYAACGRANQIFVYNLASGQTVARLTDPALIKSGLYASQGVAHADLVQSLAFSPDGNLLASGGYREVKLWRRPRDVQRAKFAGVGAEVKSLAISPDGTWAATGEVSGAIQLWKLADPKEPKTLAGHSAAVTCLQFVPGQARLVSSSLDKTIRIWNVADGAAAGQVETPSAINALAVLPGGTQIASGGADNVVRLWTVNADGSLAAGAQLPPHAQPVTALATSTAEGVSLVSASADGIARIWNVAAAQVLREMNHGAAVTALAVRPDGKQIATAGADNLVKLWNAADAQPWKAPVAPSPAPMKGDYRAQFALAGLERVQTSLAAKLEDDKKAVTDAEAKIITTSAAVTATQTAKEAAAKAKTEKAAAVKAPTDAKAAADKELAAAQAAVKEAADKAAAAKAALDKEPANAELAKANEAAQKAAAEVAKPIKDLEKKVADAAAALAKATQESTTADAGNTAAEQAAVAAVAAVKKSVTDVPLAEKALAVSQEAFKKIQAEVETGKQQVAAADKPIRGLSYSADGLLLVSASDNGLVRTWSSESGSPVETYAGHQGPVAAAAFAPDGAIVSAGADAIVWNTSSAWTLERTIGGTDNPELLADRVTALAFTPDGKLLATGSGEPSRGGELKLWNVADGSFARGIADAHSDTVFGLEFSPDGQFLASCAADRFVKVWNAATGAPARSFEGHTHHVLDVAWKADGKTLASCGADNVIKVWDFVTGDQKRTTAPFGKEVTSLGFAGATQKVVATSGDKTVRLVNTDNGASERTFAGSTDFMYSCALSPDGRVALAGGQDSVLFAWLVESGQVLKSFPPPKADDSKPAAEKPLGQTAGS
ncbi:MAG TPA: c-type cytochrome domain-containing protein [Pirellulales bacterium]|nr:c-type cytochrome domain-containing protein [Pirellulales bacterium]